MKNRYKELKEDVIDEEMAIKETLERVHKFYLNKFGMGILYILTGGIFLVGWLIDLFMIPRQVRLYNEQIAK